MLFLQKPAIRKIIISSAIVATPFAFLQINLNKKILKDKRYRCSDIREMECNY
jgi:hypothetical protein